MASISSNPETTAVCQDWMVELRGFELMAIAAFMPWQRGGVSRI
jgi:hypothetical protein